MSEAALLLQPLRSPLGCKPCGLAIATAARVAQAAGRGVVAIAAAFPPGGEAALAGLRDTKARLAALSASMPDQDPTP